MIQARINLFSVGLKVSFEPDKVQPVCTSIRQNTQAFEWINTLTSFNYAIVKIFYVNLGYLSPLKENLMTNFKIALQLVTRRSKRRCVHLHIYIINTFN